jgi:NADH:ubiquinone oxidoreductase subunit 6 (subunit J)
MVLFVFVVMLLNLGLRAKEAERALLTRRMWVGPSVLVAILVALLVHALTVRPVPTQAAGSGPEAVGVALFGPYVLGVELASLLLMSALLGAYHLGIRHRDGGAARPAERGGRHAIERRRPRARAGVGAVRAGTPGAARST